MGSGEYGGNGSVHWHNQNQMDKDHDNGHYNHNGIDEYPGISDGGEFTVQVFDIPQGNFSWENGVLTATLPIKHGKIFTKQILVSWPDPPYGTVTSARKATSARKKATSKPPARKKASAAGARKKKR